MITKQKHQHQQKEGHNKHCPHFYSIAESIMWQLPQTSHEEWGDPPHQEREEWKPQGYIQYIAYIVKLVLEIQSYKDFCYNWTTAW